MEEEYPVFCFFFFWGGVICALPSASTGGRERAAQSEQLQLRRRSPPQTQPLLRLVSLHCIIPTSHHGKCDIAFDSGDAPLSCFGFQCPTCVMGGNCGESRSISVIISPTSPGFFVVLSFFFSLSCPLKSSPIFLPSDYQNLCVSFQVF